MNNRRFRGYIPHHLFNPELDYQTPRQSPAILDSPRGAKQTHAAPQYNSSRSQLCLPHSCTKLQPLHHDLQRGNAHTSLSVNTFSYKRYSGGTWAADFLEHKKASVTEGTLYIQEGSINCHQVKMLECFCGSLNGEKTNRPKLRRQGKQREAKSLHQIFSVTQGW